MFITMPIWVDADACPGVIKEILFRAAERAQIATTLVANQYIKTPPSKVISSIQVGQGFDVADNEIVLRVTAGDLVITGDIPLAEGETQEDVEAAAAEKSKPKLIDEEFIADMQVCWAI